MEYLEDNPNFEINTKDKLKTEKSNKILNNHLSEKENKVLSENNLIKNSSTSISNSNIANNSKDISSKITTCIKRIKAQQNQYQVIIVFLLKIKIIK